jgi:hypothetical protein
MLSEAMINQVNEGLTKAEILVEQQKFVEWLRATGWYSEFISTVHMQLMYFVWKKCQGEVLTKDETDGLVDYAKELNKERAEGLAYLTQR